MKNKILAYDLGTGGVKTTLYSEDGDRVADCFFPYETSYPQSGYHEQNPLDWWKAVVDSTKLILDRQTIDPEEIACLAVSGHSLGVIPIGKDGGLLSENVPIWSDSRAKEQSRQFFSQISEAEWYSMTGNGFPAQLYSIFKLMWLKQLQTQVYEKTDKFIGTKDYINYRLTGRLCTDPSYASGSGVFDLMAWNYRPDYIEASGIASEKFPEIVPSTEIIGTLSPAAAQELGLSQTTQVACGGVDNACMALGAGCIQNGSAYTSLGSSAWIAVAGEKPIIDLRNKPYIFAHCIPHHFVSSVAIFAAGSSFRWLRDTVCRNLLHEPEPYDAMTRLAEQSVIGANKLIFNPSLAGGSSLDRSPNIKGGFIGLQLGHTQGDLIRAAMEGICLNLKIALDVMETYTDLSEDMLLVGGGGKSQFWRQLFADVYNKNIIKTNIGQDAGSLGAAAVAAVGSGLWSDFSVVNRIHKIQSRISPDPVRCEKYQVILDLFRRIAKIQADLGEMIEDTSW